MLVNKNKTINKRKNDKNENIESVRSWIRKIEQTTNSISSRLAAVEKRITNSSKIQSENSISGFTIIDGPIDKVISKIKDSDNIDNQMEYIFGVVEGELSLLQDGIECQEEELKILKDKINEINNSLFEIREDIKKDKEIQIKYLSDFNGRIEKIERRAPPFLKLGKMEVPIEISGVISGFIALFAAFFVYIEQTSFLISPMFLALIGIIFIGSAVLKSIKTKPD